jgi:ketosteroid isomerase-like protein
MATIDESAIRFELRSLAEQYARGVDRRVDGDEFVALFHPDAVITIHDPSESTEPRELQGTERLARIPEVIQRYPKTFHMLGQSTYEIGDGEATGEVYCIAHHLTPGAQHGSPEEAGTDYVMFIRYEDTYRPDAEGAWKFAQRRLRVDWTETRAVNPPTA